ncbi:MAG: CvpA family protein [Dehalococcoidia bacterium]
MNWLDIVLIVVLALFILSGLIQGFIRTALALAGLIVGIFLAGRYYVAFGNWLPIANTNIANIVAFAIIFIAVMVAAVLLAFFLRRIISLIMLGWADKLLGALFGLVLGALFCGAVLTLLTRFLTIEATVGGSWIATMLLDRFPVVLALLPEEFDAVREFFQ